jgi:hypothetical protein
MLFSHPDSKKEKRQKNIYEQEIAKYPDEQYDA